MSLSKMLIPIFICLAIAACSIPKREGRLSGEKVVVIKIKNTPDAYTFSKLEQIILENSEDGFIDATVFSNVENKIDGEKIVEELTTSYAIKSELVVTEAVTGIQVQLNKFNQSECYVNQLDDFNWYKSTNSEIREFNQSEICATSNNDRLLRI